MSAPPRTGGSTRVAVAHAVLIVASGLTLFPLIWLVAAAFTPNDLVLSRPFRLWPEQPTLDNFRVAAERYPIWTWLLNSVLVAGAVTIGKLLLTLPSAFAFATGRLPLRDGLFGFVVATMSFPTIMMIVPTYLFVARVGWYDTLTAVIAPAIPYIGFYVFFFRQAFKQLPVEMFEAARIDGAGVFRQFRDIALPNVAPVIPALAAFAFMGAWNIYLWAQLTLESVALKTLSVGIAQFADVEGAQQLWGPLMATNLISIVPVMLIVIACRRSISRAFRVE
jgi:ABC-type glycerol-3-phosphate transport system permease component